jgi:hypothetical protein
LIADSLKLLPIDIRPCEFYNPAMTEPESALADDGNAGSIPAENRYRSKPR